MTSTTTTEPGIATRPCSFCGAEITSTVADVNYCRECYYSGRWIDVNARPERDEAATARIVIGAIVDGLGLDARLTHTGGGCWAITLGDETGRGPEILVTAEDDASIPETLVGSWCVGAYHSAEDGWDVDRDPQWFPVGLPALLAAVDRAADVLGITS